MRVRCSSPPLGVQHLHEQGLRVARAGQMLEVEEVLAAHRDRPEIWQHRHESIELVLNSRKHWLVRVLVESVGGQNAGWEYLREHEGES